MKKINNKGFTLIELLAVVTIMGILMIVATQAVTRIIENTRRDTFATVSREYINAVRNAVLADNIECYVNRNYITASATPDGTYYFVVDSVNKTDVSGSNAYSGGNTASGADDLLESGGKSPFGNAEMKGYVKWIKSSKGNGSVTTKYYAYLTDSGLHGMNDEWEENQVKRANIKTKVDSAAPTIPTKATGNLYYCKVS